MTVRLDAGAASVIAGQHEDAAASIDASAATMPPSADAGYGTDFVYAILAAVTETAGEVALVNLALAAMVSDVALDLGRTDAEIVREFGRLRGVVS